MDGHGARLPQILAEIEITDHKLHQNTNYEAARLAARHGAPVIEAEIEPYKAKMAQKAAEQQFQAKLRGVDLAIQHGIISGDPDDLNEIAAIFQLPAFQHSADGMDNLKRAAAIAHHPNHVRITPRSATTKARSDAGKKSISGLPTLTANVRQPSTGVRGSVNKAVDKFR